MKTFKEGDEVLLTRAPTRQECEAYNNLGTKETWPGGAAERKNRWLTSRTKLILSEFINGYENRFCVVVVNKAEVDRYNDSGTWTVPTAALRHYKIKPTIII